MSILLPSPPRRCGHELAGDGSVSQAWRLFPCSCSRAQQHIPDSVSLSFARVFRRKSKIGTRLVEAVVIFMRNSQDGDSILCNHTSREKTKIPILMRLSSKAMITCKASWMTHSVSFCLSCLLNSTRSKVLDHPLPLRKGSRFWCIVRLTMSFISIGDIKSCAVLAYKVYLYGFSKVKNPGIASLF